MVNASKTLETPKPEHFHVKYEAQELDITDSDIFRIWLAVKQNPARTLGSSCFLARISGFNSWKATALFVTYSIQIVEVVIHCIETC